MYLAAVVARASLQAGEAHGGPCHKPFECPCDRGQYCLAVPEPQDKVTCKFYLRGIDGAQQGAA